MKCLTKLVTIFKPKKRLNDTLEREALGIEDEYDELGGISICDSSIFTNGNYAVSPANHSYANEWIQQQVITMTQQTQQQRHQHQQDDSNVSILSSDDDDIFDMLAKNNHNKSSNIPTQEVKASRDDISVSSLDTANDFYAELLMKRGPSTLGPGRDDEYEAEEAEASLYSNSSNDIASLLGNTRPLASGVHGRDASDHRYAGECSDNSRDEYTRGLMLDTDRESTCSSEEQLWEQDKSIDHSQLLPTKIGEAEVTHSKYDGSDTEDYAASQNNDEVVTNPTCTQTDEKNYESDDGTETLADYPRSIDSMVSPKSIDINAKQRYQKIQLSADWSTTTETEAEMTETDTEATTEVHNSSSEKENVSSYLSDTTSLVSSSSSPSRDRTVLIKGLPSGSIAKTSSIRRGSPLVDRNW